jgi:toxin ParE1/3/4
MCSTPLSPKTPTYVVRLRIAQAAQQDLREIRIHSKLAFGAAITKEYLVGIRATFSRLREHPFAGAAESDLGRGLRGVSYRSHRIFYRILSGENELVIVRVLHHSRDAGSAIGSEQ